MSALIVLVIVIAVLAAYLLTGWRLALWALPRAWENARRAWSYDDMIRGSVKAQTAAMVLAWPALLPGRVISDALNRVVSEGDPEVLAARLREQAARIRELERELGIEP